jgi:serine/threonine protein kinase
VVLSKLKKPISFETTFGTYVVDELLGEGGAGRVYGGNANDQSPIALKVLAEERVTTDKRRRFKNEISFLSRNKHQNIVTVIDHGIARSPEANGLFYVMQRYKCNLRDLIKGGIEPASVLPLFTQILNGVEAAHLQNAVHRDLKPENILYADNTNTLAIADFGIARFTEDLVATQVDTATGQRLANFLYAAPEQRLIGSQVGATADIYALGLMLNEMFTGVVPHGTEYRLIAHVSKEWGFLDGIVEKMLRQTPADRYASIQDLKLAIGRYQAEAATLQKISNIDGTIIKAGEIDEPLAITPPQLVSADWNRGQLTLVLDRTVSPEWIQALYNMGSYGALLGKDPGQFVFQGDRTTVMASEHQIQTIIDHFKRWLPSATQTLRLQLEQKARKQEIDQREYLRREREAEEQRLRVLSRIKI